MRAGIKWGVILGTAVCVWTLILHTLGFYTTRIAAAQAADTVATILPVTAIVLALRERKRHAPLAISEAVAIAVVVGLVSAPISAGFLWWYHHYMNPQWIDYIVDHRRLTMEAVGATPESIARMEVSQRAAATDRAQLTAAFIGSTILSLAVGLVAAAIMRTRGPRRPA